MVLACLVGGGVLTTTYFTRKMITIEGLDSLAFLAGEPKAVATATLRSRSVVPSENATVSFSKITIMYCTEKTLWAPIVVALGINIFAHAGMWYQNRSESKRVQDEKSSSKDACYYDEKVLRELLKPQGLDPIHIADGIALSSRRGWLLRFLFAIFFQDQTQGASRPRKIIAAIRHHNEAVHELERVIVRYGHKKEADGHVRPGIVVHIMRDFIQCLKKIRKSRKKYTKYVNRKEKGLVQANHGKPSEMLRTQGGPTEFGASTMTLVYVTFPSTKDACAAFKALQEKKQISLGTEKRYAPGNHIMFAPPAKESWLDVGDRASTARIKDFGFYVTFVMTVGVAAALTMIIGSLYNVATLAQIIHWNFLQSFVKQHPNIVGNTSSILPPILVALTNVLLVPLLIEVLAKRKSSRAESELDQAALRLSSSQPVLYICADISNLPCRQDCPPSDLRDLKLLGIVAHLSDSKLVAAIPQAKCSSSVTMSRPSVKVLYVVLVQTKGRRSYLTSNANIANVVASGHCNSHHAAYRPTVRYDLSSTHVSH
ncbi:hypothetical protein QFC19_003580 [Naganishia cerealis]|uniref:Uncharacterized protein n=1 Tax=Naganishia cerealis TaxID=610337 RepID=A0ACC2W2D2_9TREE|nr:hypothetical protein QFC19_003580 [Naganishia cerealis]